MEAFHRLHRFQLKDSDIVVAIGISGDVDIPQRLADYQTPDPEGVLAETYAEATYLKYNSVLANNARLCASPEEWNGHFLDNLKALSSRGPDPSAVAYVSEAFVLIEAFVENDPQVAGSVLMRRGWNNDEVVDFLVTNRTLRLRYAGLPALGALLLYAARHSSMATTNLVHVETAAHSAVYWEQYLHKGNEFLRQDTCEIARDRVSAIVASMDYWTEVVGT